jgi:hypothetical protein
MGIADQIIEEEPEEGEVDERTAMEIALQQARAQRTPGRRHARRRSPDPDLSEREDILARTLEQHSKR